MRAVLILTLLLGLAAEAQAVDGVIEINQARAEAGGVTPTDITGFPVTIGVPGSYRLTGNLDVTRAQSPENVTAIRIEADDVTLDLNGFGIFGPTTCSGTVPVTCTPSGAGDLIRGLGRRISVRNGTIHGAGRAGVLIDANGAVVEELKVSNCRSHGIWVLADSRILGNVVTGNGGIGIIGDGVIQANVVRSNGSGGISSGPSSGQISDNSVDYNQGPGIQNGGVVMRNSIRSNSGLGISGASAFGHNLIVENNGFVGNPPQTLGGIEIAPNRCGNDTICP